MKKIIIIGLITYSFVTNLVLAQGQIRLSIENHQAKNSSLQGHEIYEVALGRPFQLNVELIDIEHDARDLVVKGIEQFQQVGSQNSSFQVSFLNGNNQSRKQVFTYSLMPKHHATIRLGPAYFKRGNIQNRLTSNILEITTVDGPKKDINAELSIQSTKLVVGEAQPITVRLISAERIHNVRLMKIPEVKSCLFRKMGDFRTTSLVRQGKRYQVIEIDYLFTPLVEGSVVIDPFVWLIAMPSGQNTHPFLNSGLFQFFAQSFEEEEVATKPVTITVNALPPSNVSINGVGDFNSFTMHLSRNKATVGELITLTMEITGNGNVDYITAPTLDMPQGIRTFEPTSLGDMKIEGGKLMGTKKIETMFRADLPGTFQIPQTTFTYFDTISRSYKALSSGPLSLTIEENVMNPAYKAPDKNEQEREPSTIIYSSDELLALQTMPLNNFSARSRAMPWSIFWVLVFFLSGVCSLSYYYWMIKAWLLHRYLKHRMSKASILKIIQSLSIEQIGLLYTYIIEFYASQLNISREHATEDVIIAFLSARNWSQNEIAQFALFLTKCAALRYTTYGNVHDFEQIKAQALSWISKF